MSDYPMLISNKLHSFRNFKKQSSEIFEFQSFAFAVRTGLEPATPCVTGMYSNQLNYRTSFVFRVQR